MAERFIPGLQSDAYSREQLARVNTFMLDLDGTFYLGEEIFPWSLKFIDSLKETGRSFVFVTNNSSRNARHYAEKITRMGLPVSERQVFTSGEATVYYLQKQGFDRRIFVVGTPDLENEFIEAGFTLTVENPSVLVLGFDLTLNYQKLRVACDLVRQGVPFIATHPDLNCPTPAGPIPDCGAIIAAITAATGIKPKIIGKPQPEMVEALCNKFNIDRQSVAMVGDRLYTDIAMGQAAGILSILVLSGETQPEDLKGSPYQPDLIARDLGEVASWLKATF